MKKVIGLVLCAAFLFSLVSCGKPMYSMKKEPSDYPSESPSLYESQGSHGENKAPSAEEYLQITENPEIGVEENSLISFSLKIDTASYRNVARYLNEGFLPPKDAVRIEEMINYFKYDKALPETDKPFSVYAELGSSPFHEDKHLAFVRVKSKDIPKESLPKSNLTFLIDTSGSMDSHDKLPLLKSAFGLLVETLTEDDVVSIVTYAGSAGVVLDSVRGDQKDKLFHAIDNLSAGGSTAGGQGISLAYKLAEKNFIQGGNNRVILATDGDFNVGVSSVSGLENLMKEKRNGGVYLTLLGFGTENLKDNKMETMAKNGNGSYHYIDSIFAAKKVLVDEATGNLFTIADDVKAQVEFNPALVDSYRLIGYENSLMSAKDFDNAKKDAGEIGAGTDVVLMFELTLREGARSGLKYQPEKQPEPNDFSDELFEVRIRYKNPGGSQSLEIKHPVKNDRILDQNSSDFTFASSVAGFGLLLRSSVYTGSFTAEKALTLAQNAKGEDPNGYRTEYMELVNRYRQITKR